ncbi:DinB family protein [Planococcus sp. 107-1]|uniref:DinB family protein n=1 Tax=Planococcus sp. 107-1 TaxID=2908840 RepID=UPI001F17CABA|nr:DinB family protein [Planococcus sp. 107-1]UJF28464.1 DinB family protein [Planococcus sp. 107-1]
MNDLKLIETYKSFLQDYSLEQIRYIPDPGVWSIGQMYDHLIVVAHEYLDSAEACSLACEENPRDKTTFGAYLFNIGGFPPIKIELPPELNASPNNEKKKEDLILELDQLMKRMSEVKMKVEKINPNYKVKHGGLGWLNAQEWLDLVAMHFRHHLRQKYELDQKLEG